MATRYVGETTEEFSIGPEDGTTKVVRGQEFKSKHKNVIDILLDNGHIREADDDDFKKPDASDYRLDDVTALIPPTILQQPHAGAEVVTPPDLSGDRNNRDVVPPGVGKAVEAGDSVGEGKP